MRPSPPAGEGQGEGDKKAKMTEEIKRRKKDSARLVWDSKPKRAPNPRDIDFQTAEVVIPNPKRDIDQLPLSFKDGKITDTEIDKQNMNRLIWGDNLLAMQALLASGYEGKINLIYIDPPFDSKADYSHKITLGENEITKEPSVIERLAYKDTWAGGIDSYLDMLYPRLQLIKRLMAENGSLWIHIGSNISHYVQQICDEVFGSDNCRNQIIVKRITKNLQRQFNFIKSLPEGHDVLLWYSRNNEIRFKPLLIDQQPAHPEGYWKDFWSNADRPTMRYEILGIRPTSGQWKWEKNRAYRAVENFEKYTEFSKKSDCSLFDFWKKNGEELEFIRKSHSNKIEHWVPPMDTKFADTVWLDMSAYSFSTGYDTEKNEDLVSRIVVNFTNENDIIADFFLGSGTTCAVAERLNRRWIGCELGKVGIQVTRARLVNQGAKPFLIENIGNYQREMIYLSGGNIGEMQRIILKLYGATPRKGSAELGVRNSLDEGRPELVYVGYPDRPVSAKKAEELAIMAQTLDGTGYTKLIILAWDYSYNYFTELENRKKAAKKAWTTEMSSLLIPPDVYEYLKQARNEEDLEPFMEKVKFYEQPYLRLGKPIVKKIGDKRELTIRIDKFTIFDFPVNQDDRDILKEIAKQDPLLLIDYWAVDWDYDGYTFKSQWQDFRGFGKKTHKVSSEANNIYEKPGKYVVAVRVVDIFGNDASATVNCEI